MAKPKIKQSSQPVPPREKRRETVDLLLRELFQLNQRGAPEGELKAQIARLATEFTRLEQTKD